jgi:hypothetical protein
MVTWPPYALVDPSADPGLVAAFTEKFHDARFGRLPVLGRQVLDAQGNDAGLYAWPILRVLGKMLDTAMTFLLIEKGAIPVPEQASQDEIEQWVRRTRTLAARWPFGNGAAALLSLATEIEGTFTIARFFPRAQWPRTARRRQQFQTSMTFWALRNVLDALVTFQVQHVPTFADLAGGVVWSAVPADKHAALEKAIADGSLERRVRDFRARPRPNVEGELMAWNLHDTLLHSGDECGRIHVPAADLGLPTQKLH